MSDMSADSFWLPQEAAAAAPVKKAKPRPEPLFLLDDKCGTPDLFAFGQ